MKTKCLLCIIILLLAHAASSFGYVLDLKAEFDDKVQVAPIQTGATYYLMKEGHFVLDISEDYAVWLKDYTKEEKKDGEISITLTVILSEPSAFQVSKPLKEQIISFSYHPAKPETMTTDESATKFIRKKLVHSSKIMEAEATIGGKAVCEAVIEMLSELSDTAQTVLSLNCGSPLYEDDHWRTQAACPSLPINLRTSGTGT